MVYQCRMHPDGRFCLPYVSDAIFGLYRLTAEDVREDASALLATIHQDDVASVISALKKSAFELTPWQQEYRVMVDDGMVRWILCDAIPEREADGGTLWHGFNTDITERKTVEKTLRLSTSRMQATLDAIPDLMFEIDLDGRYHDFHSPRTDLLVAPAQDLMGQLVSDALPADAARVVMAALKEANDKGYSSGKQFELMLAQCPIWFELSISRKTTEPGDEPRFIVLSRDITERIEAQKKLHISDLALKSISQGVLIADSDGRILSTNDAFLFITGYSEDEVLGRHCDFIQGPGTNACTVAAIHLAKLNATEFTGEILNYRKDGGTFWNELSISPAFDAKGQLIHFIGITRDVTARKLNARPSLWPSRTNSAASTAPCACSVTAIWP